MNLLLVLGEVVHYKLNYFRSIPLVRVGEDSKTLLEKCSGCQKSKGID